MAPAAAVGAEAPPMRRQLYFAPLTVTSGLFRAHGVEPAVIALLPPTPAPTLLRQRRPAHPTRAHFCTKSGGPDCALNQSFMFTGPTSWPSAFSFHCREASAYTASFEWPLTSGTVRHVATYSPSRHST